MKSEITASDIKESTCMWSFLIGTTLCINESLLNRRGWGVTVMLEGRIEKRNFGGHTL